VYPIDQSLRFNSTDSAYLNRTPATAGNRQTFTWSGWVKRGALSSNQAVFSASDGTQNNEFLVFFGTGNTLAIQQTVGGTSSGQISCVTNAVYRDTSAWYHIVLAIDTTQATSTNRLLLYVNGVSQTFSSYSVGSSINTWVNNTNAHAIGKRGDASLYFNGYLAEVNFIDGSALDPTSFGEEDDNGVWRPIKYADSYTGNSFYLKFANGDGTDSSGLSNTWTANNFTTSGTGTDVMDDTPTTNWATLNPLTTSNTTRSPSDGNLVIAFGGTYPTNMLGSFGASSGKWYWEVGFAGGDSSSGHACGIAVGDWANRNTDPQTVSTPFSHYIDSRGNFWNSGSSTANSTNFTVGDIIGVALDADNDEVSFYKNGTIVGSAQSLETGQTWFPLQKNSSFTALTQTVNFGQRAFEYTPPTGFNAPNTNNLSAPDIADGSDYFQSVLDTGANILSSAQSAVSNGLWWVKDRDNSNQHQFVDSVRGGSLALTCPTLAAEGSYSAPSGSSVAWCWKEGATPGFDIVTYTGDGTTSANRLIDHSLGVTPDFIITKKRSSGTTDGGWSTWHKDLGGNYGVWLQLPNARNVSMWAGYTNFSSTKFTPPDLNYGNENAQTYVNYLWAEVEGYSRFGSYIGNGQTGDLAPFVWCGFRPAFLMVKAATTSANWIICDAARNTYNVIGDELVANAANAESGLAITTAVDFTANGFKIRTNDANWNSNTQTLIFAAFAENPVGGSGVSPATAR